MATSSTFATNNQYVVYNIVVTENSTSTNDNTSNVTVKVNFWRTNTGFTTYGNGTVYCTINGTTYSQSVTTSQTITNTARTLFTKTLNIPHNTDGTKSLTCSAYINLPGILSSSNQSFTTALTTIPRASTISALTASVTVNGTNTSSVTISRASSSFTHTVTWSIGSYSYSKTGVGTSTSYAIPMSWLNAIPNATSGSCTVKVITYNGSTKIGSTSKSCTLVVPSTVVPSIGSITATRVDGTVPSSWGIYVKGKSKATLTINSMAGSYGSAPSSTFISGGGFSSGTNPYTTGYLNTAGTITFTGYIKDTRGRSSISKGVPITVYDYSNPSFSTTTAVRCNNDGTVNASGTCIKVTVTFVFSSCNSKNTASCNVKYKANSATGWSPTQNIASGVSVIIGGDSINVNNSYQVMFSVTDAFTTVTKTVTVSGDAIPVNIRSGGKGIAFGKMSESDMFEVDMTSTFNKSLTVKSNLYLNGGLIYPTGSTSSGFSMGYSSSKLILQAQSSNISMTTSQLDISSSKINFNNDAHFTGSTNYLYMSSDSTSSIYWTDTGTQLTIRNTGNSYVRLTKTTVVIHASSWATGTGTAAYITSAGNIVKYSSSKRYKTNINYDIDKGVYHRQLMSFKPCEYSYKSSPDLLEFGMIAEDVNNVNNNLIVIDDNTKLVESYKDRDVLTMLIVEAQEKDKTIKDLQNTITKLSKRLNDIENKI